MRLLGALIAALLLATAVFLWGYTAGGGNDGRVVRVGAGPAPGLVDQVFDKIRSAAVHPPGDKVLERGAIKGMVDILKKRDDPYAYFFSPKSYRSFQELTTGEFSGIGVWLRNQSGRLAVASVLPSSPAQRAGLHKGDVIDSINGRVVKDLASEEAVTKIKGPAGSRVKLGVERNGRELVFTLTRTSLELPTVISHLTHSGDYGYVRLIEFSKGAGRQVRRSVGSLTAAGARGIILDLRDDGGGLFTEAIDVASIFLDKGVIVRYRERSGPQRVYRALGNSLGDVPLVVLVNGGTASASEIVAGALQDRDRAILVGTRTYGKGSVQQVLPLPDSSALKITTAAYLTPKGRNINGKGIEPDVEVTSGARAQRERAIQILSGIAVSLAGSRG